MNVVMIYEIAVDGMARAQANYFVHRARLNEFYARGLLLMKGPHANATEGAVGVFTSREAAEEFVEGDPFVVNGVVAQWRLREWSEALA
ncbi:MAG: hypothetical protein JWM78_1536 [Verrucomicrobiaceae bacterium]|nr:hypothetical protein [Verrucomicrobiaceae bacterium]